jgi:hypothetical protein
MSDKLIIQEVLGELKTEFGAALLGVLATGSRVRGEGDASSDIDLHVVIDQPRRQRRNIVVAGVEVEMFINPLFQIARYFDEGRASGRGVDQHMWSTGYAVYDPHGVVVELQEQARQQWEVGPPPIGGSGWPVRYLPADALRDIGDVIGRDAEQAQVMIGALLADLIGLHYRLQLRWRVKGKRTLGDLQTWDAAAAELVRGACRGTAAERFTALESLMQYVLAPVGGPHPLEWRTEWEDVHP